MTKKKKYAISIISIVILLIVGIIGWFVYQQVQPHPLGNKLEYVGKQDYGCLFFCDSNPTTNYYYETDMSLDDLEVYFENAQIVSKPVQTTTNFKNDSTTLSLIQFSNVKSQKKFVLTYYSDGVLLAKDNNLNVSKKHILMVDSKDYNNVFSSL